MRKKLVSHWMKPTFLMIVQRFLIISERLSSHSQCNYQFTGLIIIINAYYLIGF